MCALFVDFRVAFDKVDTEKIFECMRGRERERERERGIIEWLVRKIKEMYARTKNKMRWERKKVNSLRRQRK
jgi:hypothetical protein